MRIWQSSQQPARISVAPAGLSRLLAAITDEDRSQLPQAILDLVRSEVDVINCALFLLPAVGQPWLLGHAEVNNPTVVASAWGAYLDQYYQRDIGLQQVLRHDNLSVLSRSSILLHQDASDIIDTGYRNDCYDNTGTSQRFAIFRKIKGNNNLLIGIYRSASAKALSASDLHYLELLADCLSEAAVQRYRIMPQTLVLSANKLDSLQQELDTKLSKREYDLILCIARGMTIPAAAKAMGIKTVSAVTYRNRGFAKLNIRTQQELFAKLMEHTDGSSAAGLMAPQSPVSPILMS